MHRVVLHLTPTPVAFLDIGKGYRENPRIGADLVGTGDMWAFFLPNDGAGVDVLALGDNGAPVPVRFTVSTGEPFGRNARRVYVERA